MRGKMNNFEILQRLSLESRFCRFQHPTKTNPVIADKFVTSVTSSRVNGGKS